MPTETEKPKTAALRIVLPMVRLSYPALFKPTAMKNADGTVGKAKFSATLLLNKKEHAATIKAVEKLIERAMLDKFQKKVSLKNVCLHDGNDKEDKEGYGDEVMYLVAKSDTRPAVVRQVGTNLEHLSEEDGVVYGGCYVDASIEVFAYKHQLGGNGVSAQLRAIRFRKDGQSFGGGGPVDAEKEFESVPADDDPANY